MSAIAVYVRACGYQYINDTTTKKSNEKPVQMLPSVRIVRVCVFRILLLLMCGAHKMFRNTHTHTQKRAICRYDYNNAPANCILTSSIQQQQVAHQVRADKHRPDGPHSPTYEQANFTHRRTGFVWLLCVYVCVFVCFSFLCSLSARDATPETSQHCCCALFYTQLV